MKNSKKALALAASILVLFLMTAAAYADVSTEPKAVYDFDNGTIVVSGAVSDTYLKSVMIAVYRPDYTKDMVTDGTATVEEAVASFDETMVAGGEYRYEFKPKATDPEGTYTVYVNLSDSKVEDCTVYYGSIDGVWEALQAAADKTDAEKLTTFNDNSKYFSGLYDVFNMLTPEGKDAVAITTLSDTNYADINEFADNLNDNSAEWLFKNTDKAEDIAYLVENYSETLGLNLKSETYKTYIAPSDAKVSAVYSTIVSQTYRKTETPADAFDKAVAVTALNNIESFGQIGDIVAKNATAFNINMSAYNSLGSPTAVLSSLFNSGAHNAATCEAFKASWDPAVTAQQNAEANVGTGNTSNGTVSSGIVSSGPGGSVSTGPSNAVQTDPSQNTTADTPLFTDLSSALWAENAITTLAKAGIVSGKTASAFAPNDSVTREEFLKMLFLCANLKIDESAVCAFGDTSSSDWHYGYIATANAMGLVNGIADDAFGVGQNITREDMAVMVIRTVSKLGVDLVMPNDKNVFTDDSAISDYAVESVYAMQKAGIINGYEDGSFGPQANATRAEAAQIIYKLCDLFLN